MALSLDEWTRQWNKIKYIAEMATYKLMAMYFFFSFFWIAIILIDMSRWRTTSLFLTEHSFVINRSKNVMVRTSSKTLKFRVKKKLRPLKSTLLILWFYEQYCASFKSSRKLYPFGLTIVNMLVWIKYFVYLNLLFFFIRFHFLFFFFSIVENFKIDKK